MPTKKTTPPAIPAATKPPSRARKPKALDVEVAPSLGGASAPLPAIDPILPATDEVTRRRVSKAAAERQQLVAEGKAKGVKPPSSGDEPKVPRTVAPTEGTQVCRTCERTLNLTKFPTKAPAADGTVGRDTQCRECRERIRLEKKGATA